MRLFEIITDKEGRELTAHGSDGFPLNIYDNDMDEFAGRYVPWHWHKECELVWVTKGALTAEGTKEPLIVREGCGLFINHNKLHSLKPYKKPGCKMINMLFDARLVAGSPRSLFYERYVLPLIGRERMEPALIDPGTRWGVEALSCLSEIWKLWRGRPFAYELKVRELLTRVWILLLENLKIPARGAAPCPYIKAALSYIHARCSEPMTIKDVARGAAVSERTLTRGFKSVLGMSPWEYVTEYRVRRAASMLAESDAAVIDICFDCGFNDNSYFTKVFKSVTGETPTAYRRRRAGKGVN